MTARLLALRAQIGGDVHGARGVFPGPGHSRKDRSLSLMDIGARVVAHSFAGDPWPIVAEYLQAHGIEGARAGELSAAERKRLDAERRAARAREQREAEKNRERAYGLWAGAKPLPDAALAYFEARGLTAPTAYLRHARDKLGPHIIAPVVDPHGGFLGVHRTYYRTDGTVAERRMLATQAGGCIRLGAPGATLAIAEGIETALSYAQIKGVPCWSARTALGLEQWRPPMGVERVIIAADGDEAGMKAARILAVVLRAFVRVEIDAAPDGADWNDVLRGKIDG